LGWLACFISRAVTKSDDRKNQQARDDQEDRGADGEHQHRQFLNFLRGLRERLEQVGNLGWIGEYGINVPGDDKHRSGEA